MVVQAPRALKNLSPTANMKLPVFCNHLSTSFFLPLRANRLRSSMIPRHDIPKDQCSSRLAVERRFFHSPAGLLVPVHLVYDAYVA